ncbi:uncharacterized protein LOC131605016 [Vicia villosa]|uniref:uncharacterized protein LOC131605016 n=1 Tax=Vicia villosa TaxID=3911 RepID=UPI00273C22EA|nr:uncharacterized protein LOC131605016 [Vicia villosa]
MSKLPQQMKEIHGMQMNSQVASCELCKGDHPTGFCPPPEGEEVNNVNNQHQGYQRQPPYHNNSYQRNSQGFQPSRFNNQHNQQQSPYQSPIPQGQSQQPQGGSSKLEDTLNQFMQVSMENQKTNVAAIKNLENQVGKLAKQLAEQQTGSSFSANTQPNPKEYCKAIVTRSGREVNNEANEEVIVEDDGFVVVEDEEDGIVVEKEKEKEEEEQLQINIPFVEALEHMPKYAKFLKDILTKKKRYPDNETIMLDVQCSAIIQRTLPRKETDPGRVILPVTIGGTYIGNGLIDLGSSINLIPLSIIKRLGNIEMKSTRMTLQLADKSTTSPYGVAQDILVKVDKFLFPVDFVVVDMEEDRDVPLILERPFMKTARMMIDIDDGLMKVRVQDEEVTFNLFEAMKHPKEKHDVFRMDVIEEEVVGVANHVHISSPLEKCLIGDYHNSFKDEEEEIEAILGRLESCGEIDQKEEKIEELDAEKKVEETKVELKLLPTHLKYVFLGENFTKPVIISSALSPKEENRLIEVLKRNEGALGWVLSDLKGISPAYCMHNIMMEDDFKPVA